MISFKSINFQRDVGTIVELLRESLSDNHSTDFFKWKHCENPFGESYGLLAYDDNQIVGVRMFMFWEFRKADKIIKAIRPVDTIVHPGYRGKGLFKKLTLKGLDACSGNYDLVFNTPNRQSLPGYLKMGWKHYPQKLQYRMAFSPGFRGKNDVQLHSANRFEVTENYYPSKSFRTHYSSEYLRWRYSGKVYHHATVMGSSDETLIIFRKEKIRGLKTLIILEAISVPGEDNKKAIEKLASKLGYPVIYYLEDEEIEKPLISFRSSQSIVVYRDDTLQVRSSIKFSAGDLEGKL